MSEKKESSFEKVRNASIIFVLVILLWMAGWALIDYMVPMDENRGAFGDKFGFVNSFFSGLAFAGIIYSIFLQSKELHYQREELKLTREEFKDQNFQTTFFNLLKTQRQIAYEFTTEIPVLKMTNPPSFVNKQIVGREFFMIAMEELKKIDDSFNLGVYELPYETDLQQRGYYNAETDQNELIEYKRAFILHYYQIDVGEFEQTKNHLVKDGTTKNSELESNNIEYLKSLYAIFERKHGHLTRHYFRHLYHLLLFFDNTFKERLNQADKTTSENLKNEQIEEIGQFVGFVKAQLSSSEMALLYYNCFKYERMLQKVQNLKLLDNLRPLELIDISHSRLLGVKLSSD